MICLIALPILAILGLFSATHRELAKESFECVFKTVTLRPCEGTLDKKLKGKIVGKTLNFNKGIGKFVLKHFETLSLIFALLMVLSLIGTVWGAYNLYAYGNCNGPNSTELCVFNPTTNSLPENCEETKIINSAEINSVKILIQPKISF
ncbi:MAG: hypothetical protein JW703_04265 [Candidatus Diapherotrites archaeon]|nr:hypothetical protein [Candidatus Diapherotrites archaeon]